MGKGNDPNAVCALSAAMTADEPVAASATTTLQGEPVTDAAALAALKESDPELHGQITNRRVVLPYEFQQMAAEATAEQLDVDPALALRMEKDEFPIALDENGDPVSGALSYAPHEAFLNPGREHVRGAEETMPGATAAAQALLARVQAGEQIAIFSDYDPDGTTSGTVMRMALERVGATDEQMTWRFAKAADGFGLTEDFVAHAHEQGATMLISLDCGSANTDAVALAQQLGMEVLIVDHHDAHPANTAEHHLNPSFINMAHAGEPFATSVRARDLLARCERSRQQASLHPDDPDAQDELEECKALAKDMIHQIDGLLGQHDAAAALVAGEELYERSKQAMADGDSAALETCRVEAGDMIAQLDAVSGTEIPSVRLAEAIERVRPAATPSRNLQVAIEKAVAAAEDGGALLPNHNSAAQLSWKFGGALIEASEGSIPEDWYAQPMYLAGTGALADAMDMDAKHTENRAFCRVPVAGGADPAPELIRAIAAELEEDPTNPGSMIRTRAVLNLPKRTTRVDASLVADGLRATDPADVKKATKALMAHYEESICIRDEMTTSALADWETRKAKLSGEPLVAAALVEGFRDDVGQARILANTLVKQEHVTAAVGVVRPDGLVKVSLSGIGSAEIGRVFDSQRLRSKLEEACAVEVELPDGSTKTSVSVGGHLRVVSGVCTQDKFDDVVKVFEEMGQEVMTRDPKKWRRPVYRNKAMWPMERMVSPDRIRRLEGEAVMLRPTTNNNRGVSVSAAVRLISTEERSPEEAKRGITRAVIEFSDGMRRDADIADEAMPAMRTGTFFEAELPMDRGRYWVSTLAAIKPAAKKQ